MKTRKILAALMAMSMVAAMSPMSASAIGTETVTSAPASGTGEANGSFEGKVDTDVFHVVLPTITNELNFIMDPQGLIKETMANSTNTKYTSKKFGTGTLFFLNATDKQDGNDYSNTSDKLTITNKSSFDVDVEISATVSGNGVVALTSDSTFANDTSASLYLALKDVPADGSDATVAPITAENGATLTATITGAPSQYEVVYDNSKYAANNGYGYALKSTATGFKTYEFQLTGATNSAGDWSEVGTDVVPKATVVWNVAKHVDSYLSTKTVSASANTVTITSAANGATVNSLTFVNGDFSSTLAAGTFYTVNGDVYTFTTKMTASANVGGTITFNFSDGHKESVTVS